MREGRGGWMERGREGWREERMEGRRELSKTEKDSTVFTIAC